MADWTDQDTDSLLPGEPWTSAKALAAFENPVALAEGAAGAPKIQTAAYDNNTVNENAMKVLQFSDSGTVSASGSVTFEIPGNLVFLPRVSGSDIEAVLANGQIKIKNISADDTKTYSISWYRIIP